jgi:hypothetical protein
MAENKITRELDTRATQQRPTSWAPAELLPEPDKQAGYAYRWVRVSALNVADPRNISAKFREGWEPVKSEEQPQFAMFADPNSRYKDNIEVGGLLLCKRPEEFNKQQQAYYDKMTRDQAEAVDNNLMRQSDPRMPIFQERRSSTTFGKGT